MTTILGLDSSAGACSAAIWRDGTIAARRSEAMERGHAERLIPMIVEVLAEAGLGFAALDAVGVTTGPGAFTGLRIGLAAARGIGLAAAKPVIGVTSFEAVAAAIPDGARARRKTIVAIDTKRGDLYVQAFTAALAADGDGAVMAPLDLVARFAGEAVLVAGDGIGILRAAAGEIPGNIVFDSEIRRPDGAAVALLADVRLAGARMGGAPWAAVEPLYLRAPDATPLSMQGRRR